MENNDLKSLTIVELSERLKNKSHAAADLTAWLSHNKQTDEAYPKVLRDRNALNTEIDALNAEIQKRGGKKPFTKSLNVSFEL